MAVRGVLTEAKVAYTSGQEGAAISGVLQHLLDLAKSAGGKRATFPRCRTHLIFPTCRTSLGMNNSGLSHKRQSNFARTSALGRRQAKCAQTEKRPGPDSIDCSIKPAHSPMLTASDHSATRCSTAASCLADPDPLTPLIDQLCTALRAALQGALDNVRAAYESETSELKSSDGWQQLHSDQQQAVLAHAALVLDERPDLSTNEQLLAELSAQPLGVLEERVHALPAKVAAARKEIAQIVDPEPTVVTVKPASATLKSKSDVDAYVTALRAELMQHIDAGETVVT